MEWIASMPGPQFLGVYAAVIICTLAGCFLALRSSTDDSLDPLVPAKPDPYEIAYLRGGSDEVGRLAIVDLARRGLIQQESNDTLIEKLTGKGKGEIGGMQAIELIRRGAADAEARAALLEAASPQISAEPVPFDLPATPRRILEVLRKHSKPLDWVQRLPEFREAARAAAEPFAARLDRAFLVSSAKRWQVWAVGSLIIYGLGGYKLFVALEKGRTNYLFLLLLAFLSTIALLLIVQRRLTLRGSQYLKKMQTANADLQTRPKTETEPLPHADLMLAVGLFGAPVLLGGPDMEFAQMLGARGMRDSGYTGDSCGSSGSDGGDSGDGCGGGGGCGGCGGE